MEREVKTWRAIGIGTIISFFALALALLNFQNSLYREILTLARQSSKAETRIDTLGKENSKAEARIDSLQSAVQALSTKSLSDDRNHETGPPDVQTKASHDKKDGPKAVKKDR